MTRTNQKRVREYWDNLQKRGVEVNLKYSRDLPDDTPGYGLKILTQFEIEVSGFAFDGCSGLFLDAGCGTGNLYLHALQLFPGISIEYVGMDISESMLKRAITRIEGEGRTHFLQGTVTDLPFGDNSFNRIPVSGVMVYCESLNKVEEVFKEFHRILKPDGVLVVDFFSRASHTTLLRKLLRRRVAPPPKIIFPLWFIRGLKRAGFTIVSYRGYDFKPYQGRTFDSKFALVRMTGKITERFSRFIEMKIVPYVPIVSLLGGRI